MQSRHIYLSLLLLLSLPLSAVDKDWHSKDDTWLSNQRIHGSTLLEMKQVWETAPDFVKGTVEHLKDPMHYKPHGAPEYRFLMLHGESGSGKSTMAKAMAMYAGWDIEFKTPADFQVGDRGDAANKLNKAIDEIILRNAYTLLIIDEINQLLENCESSSHDNDATSKALWTAMDKIHGNDKIFIVGTANRLQKIPIQVKTRIHARNQFISMPKDVESRFKIFKNIFRRRGFTLVDHGEKEVKEVLEKEKTWSGRNFDEYGFAAQRVINDVLECPNIVDGQPVGGKVMRMAYEIMDESDKNHLHMDLVELSDDERQDLIQAQNIDLQVMVQRAQKNTWLGLKAPGITDKDGNTIMNRIKTKAQKLVSKKQYEADTLQDKVF